MQQDLAARAALDHVPLEQPRVEVRPGARVVRGAHEAEAHALAAQPQDAAPAGAGRRRELDPPQLYDLAEDPHEQVNLADDPAFSRQLHEMERLLLAQQRLFDQ